MLAILVPTRRQVNAKALLREVHAAEEGLEAGVETTGLNYRKRARDAKGGLTVQAPLAFRLVLLLVDFQVTVSQLVL